MQIKRQVPDNVAKLQAMLFAQFAAFDELKHQHETLKSSKIDDKEEIKRLNLLLDKLKRMLFGQKFERLIAQVNQLELEIEELEINQGIQASIIEAKSNAPRVAPTRRPLPEHLPRDIQGHYPADAACPDCGGAWKKIGEDVSEVLEQIRRASRHSPCSSTHDLYMLRSDGTGACAESPDCS